MSSVFQFRLVTLIALTQNCGSNHRASDFSFFQQTHNVQISPYILLVISLGYNLQFYVLFTISNNPSSYSSAVISKSEKRFPFYIDLALKNVFPNPKRLSRPISRPLSITCLFCNLMELSTSPETTCLFCNLIEVSYSSF